MLSMDMILKLFKIIVNINISVGIPKWKVSKYGVFSGPYFLFSRIRTECEDFGSRENKNQKKLLIWTLITQCIGQLKKKRFGIKKIFSMSAFLLTSSNIALQFLLNLFGFYIAHFKIFKFYIFVNSNYFWGLTSLLRKSYLGSRFLL